MTIFDRGSDLAQGFENVHRLQTVAGKGDDRVQCHVQGLRLTSYKETHSRAETSLSEGHNDQ